MWKRLSRPSRRAVYVVSIFSFLLPFVSVIPGCEGRPGGEPRLYHGYELIRGTSLAGHSQNLTSFLVVLIGIASLLFALSFLRRSTSLALEGFLRSWEAILASIAAALIVGVPSWAFLFDRVSPEIGQFVGIASWTFLYLAGVVDALGLVARLRYTPAAVGPVSERSRWQVPATVLPALLALTGPAAIFFLSVGNPFKQMWVFPSLAASASFLSICLAAYFVTCGLRVRERWAEVCRSSASLTVLLGGMLSGWILIERPFLIIAGLPIVSVWLSAMVFSGIVAILVGYVPSAESASRFAYYFNPVRSPHYPVMALGTLSLVLSTRITQHRLWLQVAIPIYAVLLISWAFAFKFQQTPRMEAHEEEVKFARSLGILSGVLALAVTLLRVESGEFAFWTNVAACFVQIALFSLFAHVRGQRGETATGINFSQLALIAASLLLGATYSLNQYGRHLAKSIDAEKTIPKVGNQIQAIEQEHAKLEEERARMKAKSGAEEAAREVRISALEEEIVALHVQRDTLESAARFNKVMSSRFLPIATSLYLPWLAAAVVRIYGLRKVM